MPAPIRAAPGIVRPGPIPTPFHVAATGHSVNYLPEYVAIWQGFFAHEGLDVTAEAPAPWDRVLDDIGDGTAQAALGGIWVPSMFLGRGERYVPFAQMSARAPLALVGRGGAAFQWSDLAGRVVAVQGGNGPSAGLLVKLLLREHGIDPGAVRFIQDLDGAMLGRLFRGGMADYLVTGAPAGLALAAAGAGHVASLLAVTGGDLPWSVYYAAGDATPGQLDVRTRFVRAIGRGMDWLLAHPAAGYRDFGYRDFLARTFPRVDPALLVSVVDTYRGCGMWTTPRIDRTAHDRWQGGIAAGHLITAPIGYDALIDVRPLG